MSLWNHLNIFSDSDRPSGDGPSSAFDPSRTGDPLGPGGGRTSIGFGETFVGTPGGMGDTRRRPVGFAPPTDDPVMPRYRTELSFKRHHELPRASATPDHPTGKPTESWQTPGEVEENHPTVEPSSPVSEGPATEQVSFLKREISFRRKRPATVDDQGSESPVDAVVEPVGGEPIAEELSRPAEIAAAAADPEPELEIQPEVVTAVDAELEVAVAAEEAPGDTPFYKREISFRRKRPAAAEEILPAAVVAGAALSGDEADEPSEQVVEGPLAAESDERSEPVVETVETPEVEPEVVAEAEQETVSDATEDRAYGAETGAEIPAAAVEAPEQLEESESPTDVEDVADDDALPIAAAVATDAPEDLAGIVGEPVLTEDASPPRRFGARMPKRGAKPARGGKARQVVGLKIGASQIAAAVVTRTEAGNELVELARRSLSAGVVVDGEVRDADALVLALKSFFDEEKLPKKDVRIGISSNRIGVRTVDISGVEDGQRFDNAVRFKAHELLPVGAHESVIDYRVLEEKPNEDGELVRRVLLVVAPRDQVEPYAKVAERAGLKLAGIDLEALGLLRAFVDPKPAAASAAEDTATVVVAIGHESSTLLVAGGGACEFTRVFDWGGHSLEQAIADSLEVHPVEAATILKHVSLSGPGRKLDTLGDEARASAVDAVRSRLTPFARELVNSLQFYQTQAQSLGIGGILVTGGTSHLEGLDETLHQMIGVDVSVGDPLRRVIPNYAADPVIDSMIGSMAVPIGLAIDDVAMRGVNLVPESTVQGTDRRKTLIRVGAPAAVIVPIAALAFLFVGAHGQVSDKQEQLDAITAEIDALPVPVTPRIDTSIVGDEAVRATAVASVLGGRVAWENVFRDLSRVLPENVWLQSLAVTQPIGGAGGSLSDIASAQAQPVTGQPAGVPTAVSIDGYTHKQTDVARLLARLATLPSLARVTLTTSEQAVVATDNVVHFVIVADLNNAGGAS